MRKLVAFILFVITASVGIAPALSQPTAQQQTKEIDLPAPTRNGGMALTEALASRRSVRSFAATKLTQQELSQLLWAAQGITDTHGRRTAPSARAQYYLHLYLATADGFFEYVPAGHKLLQLSAKDIRSALSTQPSVNAAPAVFLIAGDYDRAGRGSSDTAARWVDLEAGHAAQNLLLQAEALHLGAVPVGGIQPQQVAQAASLPRNSVPIYLIPVGHSK